MKTYLECIPCFFKQGLFASRVAKLDPKTQKKILDGIAEIIPEISLDSSPPEIALHVYNSIRENSSIEDPFKEKKEENIEIALEMYPELKEMIKKSADPLLMATKIAIAGNIIDYGAADNFDIHKTLNRTLESPFSIDDYRAFKEDVSGASSILYLGDNAGEAVFDRILMEEITGNIKFAVREKPIINDVTMKDAKKSGVSECSDVISSGSDAPGTILGRCNSEFLDIYNSADVVISKGQGNFETLSEEKRPIYFLLKIKCPVIAEDIGAPEKSIILMKKSK